MVVLVVTRYYWCCFAHTSSRKTFVRRSTLDRSPRSAVMIAASVTAYTAYVICHSGDQPTRIYVPFPRNVYGGSVLAPVFPPVPLHQQSRQLAPTPVGVIVARRKHTAKKKTTRKSRRKSGRTSVQKGERKISAKIGAKIGLTLVWKLGWKQMLYCMYHSNLIIACRDSCRWKGKMGAKMG